MFLGAALAFASVTVGNSESFQAKVLPSLVPPEIDLSEIPWFASARRVYNRVEVPRRRAAEALEHSAAPTEDFAHPCTVLEGNHKAASQSSSPSIDNGCNQYAWASARGSTCRLMQRLGRSYP